MPFKFEKLSVWQEAIVLSSNINDLCKTFPKDELFILTSQIKRAADSVSLNSAEGSTGQTDAEFKKFLGYAVRSAIEVVTCLYLAKSRNYIDDQIFKKQYAFLDSLCKKIQALRNSIN